MLNILCFPNFFAQFCCFCYFFALRFAYFPSFPYPFSLFSLNFSLFPSNSPKSTLTICKSQNIFVTLYRLSRKGLTKDIITAFIDALFLASLNSENSLNTVKAMQQ